MAEQAKTLLIGVFVVLASALFVGVVYFINPTVGDCAKTFRVRFSEIDKINIGSRVIFAGKPVGEVTGIYLLPASREGDPDRFGRLYIYELEICIDSSVEIYDTDEITVYTSGLLGERSVAIIPRTAKPGEVATPLDDDDVIFAKASTSVEETLRDLGALADKAERALEVFTEVLDTNKGKISESFTALKGSLEEITVAMKTVNETKLVESVSEATSKLAITLTSLDRQLVQMEERDLWNKTAKVMDNLGSITDSLNEPEKLAAIINNIHQVSEDLKDFEFQITDKLDSALDSMQSTFSSARTVLDEGAQITSDLRVIVHNIRSGRGTIGRLFIDDELYLKANAVMGRADTLVSDINNYGLLFHREKGWQRLRQKRLATSRNLKTCRPITDCFQDEFGKINASLSRLAMLLRQAEVQEGRDQEINDKQFNRVFRELLTDVRELAETLEFYNEHISLTDSEDNPS